MINDNVNRYKNRVQSVEDMLESFLKPVYEKQGYTLTKLQLYWEKIVGDELGKFSMPVKIITEKFHKTKRNMLCVEVANSYAAENISYKKDVFIERIKIFTGFNAIDDIKQPRLIPKQIKIDNSLSINDIKLTESERNFIESFLEEFENDNLKDALRLLAEAVMKKARINH